MFIYENDRIISRHLSSIRPTCSPFSFCIFYCKSLVVTSNGRALTRTLRNSYDFSVNLLYVSISMFPRHTQSSLEGFAMSLNSCFAAWPCHFFNPAHYRKTATRGRWWLTFQKTAHCLISALKNIHGNYFYSVKAIRMKKKLS